MKFQRTLFFMVAALIMSTAFYSCNPKTAKKTSETVETTDSGVQHFRSLLFSETPFDLERGIHKLTAEEALTVNNYKFTYDDSDRLVEIVYGRGEEILSYGSLRGAAKIVYTYDGDKQMKHFYNKKGEQIESQGVFTAEYVLNEKGVRTALAFFDKEGTPVENQNNINRYTWTKLDNGLVQELRYNLANEEIVMNPFCPFYELRFEYDENGYATKMMNYRADTLYNCTAENCGDIGVSYFQFENNEAGDLLGFSVHNTIGQLSNLYWGWAKRVNKVDANGYNVEMAIYDQDDEYLSGKNVPVIQSVYDEHGALIRTKNLDTERNLINNPNDGVAITEYKYDEKGNRLETLKFDKDMLAVVTE